MNPRRLLFVDDDTNLLAGLERLLRKHRTHWEMTFVSSASEALAILEQQPMDIVISDMRMPQMDGATFLASVRDKYPDTARLIFSGQADKASILRAFPVAHQFLQKPCEPKILEAVLERACQLRDVLRDPTIRKLLGGVTSLPAPLRLYQELERIAADPKASLVSLAATIEQDPSISLKLLQLVNSAYFGVSNRVTSISQAINYVGLDLLKSLLLSHAMGQSFKGASLGSFSLDEFQEGALAQATVTSRILGEKPLAQDGFTLGLVHDIGRLALAFVTPERYSEVIALFESSGRPLTDIETELLGTHHAQVGAYLLTMWGLPSSIVEPTLYHHDSAGLQDTQARMVTALHLAQHLVAKIRKPAAPSAVEPTFAVEALTKAGLSTDLVAWERIARGALNGERRV